MPGAQFNKCQGECHLLEKWAYFQYLLAMYHPLVMAIAYLLCLLVSFHTTWSVSLMREVCTVLYCDGI